MARKFRFRLETVQRLRQQSRDVQRRVVAEHVRAVEVVRWRIDSLTDAMTVTVDASRDTLCKGSLDVNSLRQHQLHRNWLQRSIEGSRDELARRQKELEEQQGTLGELSKQLKVIEKLRERQWERFRFEIAREEQMDNDEAATQQYARRMRSMRDEVPV